MFLVYIPLRNQNRYALKLLINLQMILIVGVLGLVVNVLGLFMFAGHGHSHGGGGHGHSHGTSGKGICQLVKICPQELTCATVPLRLFIFFVGSKYHVIARVGIPT